MNVFGKCLKNALEMIHLKMVFPFRKRSSFNLSTIDLELTMKEVLDLVLKFINSSLSLL